MPHYRPQYDQGLRSTLTLNDTLGEEIAEFEYFPASDEFLDPEGREMEAMNETDFVIVRMETDKGDTVTRLVSIEQLEVLVNALKALRQGWVSKV